MITYWEVEGRDAAAHSDRLATRVAEIATLHYEPTRGTVTHTHKNEHVLKVPHDDSFYVRVRTWNGLAVDLVGPAGVVAEALHRH